jgi:hypothetical protein
MPGKKSRTSSSPARHALYAQLLLFPERAEYLGQERYDAYRVRLDHWRDLAAEFRRSFEAVYERQSASVLLVHGPQGAGKTLFTIRLVNDFAGAGTLDEDNLWHLLAGGDGARPEIVAKAKDTTVLRRVEPRSGWLDEERRFAQQDSHAMRVFLFDDVHKDAFLREWAALTQGEYLRMKGDGRDGPVIESVAQRIVEDCRGDFKRSLFVVLSNDDNLLGRLHGELEKSHRGLARKISLPLPAPSLKEEIVRTNTNRLNQRSYWYCLDQGGPDEKEGAYRVLTDPDGGFYDSFQAIDRALAAQNKRTGRPANKNLITLVTLGSDPAHVESFLGDYELSTAEEEVLPHVGVWLFRETWASSLTAGADGDYARRASLVESEFALRWVALDMAAARCLCEDGADEDAAAAIVELIRTAPSIADKAPVKTRSKQRLAEADQRAGAAPPAATLAFAERFRSAGQARSRDYEPIIARRLAQPLSHGLHALGSVRPDITLAQYEPCAVTRATSDDPKAIEIAIRRACHVVELTAHLQPDLRGLGDYLRAKVLVYADLLESV